MKEIFKRVIRENKVKNSADMSKKTNRTESPLINHCAPVSRYYHITLPSAFFKKIFITVIVIVFAVQLKAQDIHFSQHNQTPLLLNPASTGFYDGYYRGILNYKSQWAVMGNPYRTFMGSFDMPIENRVNPYGAYLGVGAFLYSDKAGDAGFGTTQGKAAVSCIIPAGEFNTLSAGIEAGVAQRSLNFEAIQWPNQYDGQSYNASLPSYEKNGTGSYMYFDMAAGVQYQLMKNFTSFSGKEVLCFTAGAALFHATKPMQRFYSGFSERLYPRMVFHSSLRYDFESSPLGIVPSVLYMRQGAAREIDAGMLLRIRTGGGTKITGFLAESALLAGVVYRHKDAVIPQVFIEMANFGFGFSYDINVSSFSGQTNYNGGLEISVKYAKMTGALYKNRH